MRLLLGITLLAGTVLGQAPWDQAAAAKYLDDRIDIWYTGARKVRTGQGETPCISCHTSLPYALARPALRRAMQVNAPTAQETRMIQEISRRVATYGSHQLFYESNEAKKIESRGTEAVLNALILTGSSAPRETVRAALAHLWETQRPDGAWDWQQFGLEPFESAGGTYQGAALAALAAGAAQRAGYRDDSAKGLERLSDYLKTGYESQPLFNQLWVAVASSQVKGLLTEAQRHQLVVELSRRQGRDGGWSMSALGPWKWSKPSAPFQPPGALDDALVAASDGLATGFVVYAIRHLGPQAGGSLIRQGVEWLAANQREFEVGGHTWKAWRAYSLNFDREHGGKHGDPLPRLFMSDLATSFAVLALTGD